MISSKALRFATGLIGLAILALAAGPLHAQGAQPMRFNVPFAFLAGGQNLPAGEYSAKSDTSLHRIVLQCQHAPCGAAVMIAFDTGRPGRAVSQKGALGFEMHGDVYILRRVGRADSRDWSELVRSKREAEIVKTQASRQLASINAE